MSLFLTLLACDTVERLAEKGLDALEGADDTGADTAASEATHMVVLIDGVAWETDAISVGPVEGGLSAPVAAFVDTDIQGELVVDEAYANEIVLSDLVNSGATASFWDVAEPDRIDVAGAFSEYPWGAGAGHLTWGTTHVGDDGAAISIVGITIEVDAAGEVLKTGLAEAGFERCQVRLAYGGEEILAFEEDCASVRYPIESFKQKPGGEPKMDVHYIGFEPDPDVVGYHDEVYWTVTDTALVSQTYNATILD